MEFLAHRFDNTPEGLSQKDTLTKQLIQQGFRVYSEKEEVASSKKENQGCLAFLVPSRSQPEPDQPGAIVVTYGRETLYCVTCGAGITLALGPCPNCQAELSTETLTDRSSALRIAEGREQAAQRTAAIDQRVDQLTNILTETNGRDHYFDWNSLRKEFLEPQPPRPVLDREPPRTAILQLAEMVPIIELLVPAVRERRLAWEKAHGEIQRRNIELLAQYDRVSHEWLARRNAFEQELAQQAEQNRLLCLAKDAETLLNYWQIVLERSPYPENFPRSYTLNYARDKQLLTIDYILPPITFLPQIGEVKYHAAQDLLEEVHVSEIWLRETYQELVVNLAFKTIYELIQSDVVDALTSVLFNGRLKKSDKPAQDNTHPLVVAIEVSKSELKKINFAQANALSCFRRLGGVLSENPAAGTPVQPISSER